MEANAQRTGRIREWRQQAREVLRVEPGTQRLSRAEAVADAVLALALTAIAVFVVSRLHTGVQVHGVPGVPPGQPLPAAPGHPTYTAVGPVADDYVVAVLAVLPLALRRRFPLAVFWTVMCAALVKPVVVTEVTALACGIAAHSAIARSRNLVPVMGSMALAVALAAAPFVKSDASLTGWSQVVLAVLVVALLVSVVRYWQQRLLASQLRVVELQQAQHEATRRAVELERNRIASELHDVVTHNVSVMVIQAGAARMVLESSPELAKEAMLAVEAGGRAAMAELRHVMGLLAASADGGRGADTRGGSGGGELEPQPGLDQLDLLVERVRAAGVPVSVEASLPAGQLPSGVDLAVYRVVQEALTNTIKHAAGASAAVAIGHDGDWLEIEVTDTGGTDTGGTGSGGTLSRGMGSSGTNAGGAGQASGHQAGGGHGLIGMRERLAVYGGTLDAGRRMGGGYRIKARVPWRAA